MHRREGKRPKLVFGSEAVGGVQRIGVRAGQRGSGRPYAVGRSDQRRRISGAGSAAPDQRRRISGAGSVAQNQWRRISGAGSMAQDQWRRISGHGSMAPDQWGQISGAHIHACGRFHASALHPPPETNTVPRRLLAAVIRAAGRSGLGDLEDAPKWRAPARVCVDRRALCTSCPPQVGRPVEPAPSKTKMRKK